MTAGTSSTESAERRDQIVDRRRELLSDNQAHRVRRSNGAALAQNGAQMGRMEAELTMLEMERSMIDSFGALDRDHRGYDTTLSLATVIRSLAEMPGRKSVVFFSEGLPVSPVLRHEARRSDFRRESRERERLHDRRARPEDEQLAVRHPEADGGVRRRTAAQTVSGRIGAASR